MIYADVLRPSVRGRSIVYDVTLVVGGSLFIALLSQIKISLPFTPVPITGQTLGVLLTGAMLGRTRGVAAIVVYLCEGLVGLPVFAGGAFGFTHMLGPTGGYLFGFIPGAFITGLLAEKGWDRKTGTTILAMVLGNLAILSVGLFWLAPFTGIDRLLELGFLPFIPGEIVKIGLAAVLLPSGWKLIGKDSSAS
ncbi:MAG: biotin transporter BioY [Candidatus Neomarinimicrobiota bacterium]